MRVIESLERIFPSLKCKEFCQEWILNLLALWVKSLFMFKFLMKSHWFTWSKTFSGELSSWYDELDARLISIRGVNGAVKLVVGPPVVDSCDCWLIWIDVGLFLWGKTPAGLPFGSMSFTLVQLRDNPQTMLCSFFTFSRLNSVMCVTCFASSSSSFSYFIALS